VLISELGKTAIVEGLASGSLGRRAGSAQNKRVVALDLGAMLAGAFG
jgi:ATP-dependent Clp protease ATP-binding subunit ClpA